MRGVCHVFTAYSSKIVYTVYGSIKRILYTKRYAAPKTGHTPYPIPPHDTLLPQVYVMM